MSANQDWIDYFIEKELRRIFDGKYLDIPTSVRKDVGISIERGIKIACEKLEMKND